MKIDLKNIKAFFKKKKITERKSFRNPYRDWVVIFVSAVVVFLIMAAASVYLFWGIQQGTVFTAGGTAAPSAKKINPQKLDEALQLIINHQKTFEELKTKKPAVTDPSI